MVCSTAKYITTYILININSDDYISLAPPSVVFQGVDRPGCCERTVQYDITDDNIAEPNEILTLSIVRSVASNQIPVEYIVQRVNVTIVDNDSECLIICSMEHVCLTYSV